MTYDTVILSESDSDNDLSAWTAIRQTIQEKIDSNIAKDGDYAELAQTISQVEEKQSFLLENILYLETFPYYIYPPIPPSQIPTTYPPTPSEPPLATPPGKVWLARESVFGEELMSKCTVPGLRGNTALPAEGISLIQETILQQRFPMFLNDTSAFKPIWKICTDALHHACSKLR